MLLTVKHFPNSLKISWAWKCLIYSTALVLASWYLNVVANLTGVQIVLIESTGSNQIANRDILIPRNLMDRFDIVSIIDYSWESLPSGQMVTAGKMICSMGIWRTDVEVGVSDQSPRKRNAMKNVRMKPRATMRNQTKFRTPPLLLQNVKLRLINTMGLPHIGFGIRARAYKFSNFSSPSYLPIWAKPCIELVARNSSTVFLKFDWFSWPLRTRVRMLDISMALTWSLGNFSREKGAERGRGWNLTGLVENFC